MADRVEMSQGHLIDLGGGAVVVHSDFIQHGGIGPACPDGFQVVAEYLDRFFHFGFGFLHSFFNDTHSKGLLFHSDTSCLSFQLDFLL